MISTSSGMEGESGRREGGNVGQGGEGGEGDLAGEKGTHPEFYLD